MSRTHASSGLEPRDFSFQLTRVYCAYLFPGSHSVAWNYPKRIYWHHAYWQTQQIRAFVCLFVLFFRRVDFKTLLFFFFKILFIYSESERGRDTGRGRSRLHVGSLTWDSIPRFSRIMPWTEGGAKPLSHLGCLKTLLNTPLCISLSLPLIFMT